MATQRTTLDQRVALGSLLQMLPTLSRRDFTERCIAALVTCTKHHTFAAIAVDPIQRAAIPSSGELVPRVGLGTWQTFDVGADVERRRQLADTLDVFVRHGGSVVDSSPMYGSSEAVLGDLMAALDARSKLFVATKVWTTGEASGVSQMRESLKKLQVERADLMQIHNLQDWRVHVRTLRRWKEEGRVRYIGITHYVDSAFEQVARIVRDESLDFVQVNLSLEEPEAATALLPLCAKRRVAFIANRPFGGGAAFARVRNQPVPAWAAEYGIESWAQYQLKWLLSHEEVTCAIPGTGNPRHMLDNLGAGKGAPLPVRARSQLAAGWRAVVG